MRSCLNQKSCGEITLQVIIDPVGPPVGAEGAVDEGEALVVVAASTRR